MVYWAILEINGTPLKKASTFFLKKLGIPRFEIYMPSLGVCSILRQKIGNSRAFFTHLIKNG